MGVLQFGRLSKSLVAWLAAASFLLQAISCAAAYCDLASQQFPDITGAWHAAQEGADAEQNCPSFVHLTDCMRQSKDPRKTQAEYSYQYRPDGCDLREFDARQAATCLVGRRLYLIGDSMAWSQFEALACLLAPVTVATNGSRLFDAEGFKTFVPMKYAGDLLLENGASVHMRGLNKYEAAAWKAVLATLPGSITASDVLVVHWAAHHIAVSQQDYEAAMWQAIMGTLSKIPARVLWREYAPAHFGGPTGRYVNDPNVQQCSPAAVGEVEINDFVKGVLQTCGKDCGNIKLLPVFQLSLPRHGMHTGEHIDKSVRGAWDAARLDCRHFCLPVVDVWNQIMLSTICGADGIA